MPERTTKTAPRTPLTRPEVVAAAVSLADEGGIGAVTMRHLAQAVGLRPMSLYHYVANKEALLDAMVDVVFTEIYLPSVTGEWRAEMRKRAESARAVMMRHPWALGLMDSRHTPGPATLGHHDAVIGCLRHAGFSVAMTAHAFALLDAYIYGFVLQEASLPFGDTRQTQEVTSEIMEQFSAEEYPHLVELAVEHVMRPGYSFSDEFDIGLDLVLDALEALARREGTG